MVTVSSPVTQGPETLHLKTYVPSIRLDTPVLLLLTLPIVGVLGPVTKDQVPCCPFRLFPPKLPFKLVDCEMV